MMVEMLRGWRHGNVTTRRTKTGFAERVREHGAAHHPEAERIMLVTDNLNTRRLANLFEACGPAEARRLMERIETEHTYKHGTWLAGGTDSGTAARTTRRDGGGDGGRSGNAAKTGISRSAPRGTGRGGAPAGGDGSDDSIQPRNGGGTTYSSPGYWLRTDDGRRIYFYSLGGSYTQPGIRLQLASRTGGGYILTDEHQNKWYFTSDGYLDYYNDASQQAWNDADTNTTNDLHTLTFGYDSSPKRLTTVTDRAGNVLTLGYNSTTHVLETITAPAIDPDNDPSPTGRVFNIEYSSGNLVHIYKAEYDSGAPKYRYTFGYDSSSGYLNSLQDCNSNTTTLAYTSSTQIQVTHPAVFDYDANTNVQTTRIYDFTWRSSDSTLNPCNVPNSSQTDVTDERGSSYKTRYTFDASGRLLTVRDPALRTVSTLTWNNDQPRGDFDGAAAELDHDVFVRHGREPAHHCGREHAHDHDESRLAQQSDEPDRSGELSRELHLW